MRFRTVLAALVLCLGVSSSLSAGVDFFLQIDGVEGESTAHNYLKQIDVLSFSWGETNTPLHTSGGGLGMASKVQMSDLTVTMRTSKASPPLFLKCATGEHIRKVVLHGVRISGDRPQEYYTITLEDVLISSFQVGGAQGGDIPVEAVAFSFAKITLEYRPQDGHGELGPVVKAGYDLKAGKKL